MRYCGLEVVRRLRYALLLCAFSTLLLPLGAAAQYRAFTLGAKQVGTSAVLGRLSPALMPVLSNVVSIASGEYHNLALKQDGTVWTWGYNEWGQLGSGAYYSSDRPIQVKGLTGVIAISAGGGHSLALKSDGTVWAWGDGYDGELGTGVSNANGIPNIVPTQVTGLTGKMTAIASGSLHNLALGADGTVWVWGDDAYGQLGDGGTTHRYTPYQLTQISNVVQIAAGSNNSMARTQDGTVWVWGWHYNNTPAQVPGLSGAASIAISDYAVLATDTSGALWSITNSSGIQATQITTLANVVSMSVNYYFANLVLQNGSVWSVGQNAYGELGDGTTTSAYGSNFMQALNITGAVQAQTGVSHAIALDSGGKVWTWGDNTDGQLGVTAPNSGGRPARVTLTLGSLASAAAGSDSVSNSFNIVAHKDGTVWAWGDNTDGQLGNGNTNSSVTPVKAGTLTKVTLVAASQNDAAFALKNDGTLWAWGNNSSGQLGVGNTTQHSTPTQVSGLTQVVAVAPGYRHTLALKSDGTVWAWGNNNTGALGIGSRTAHSAPIQVPGLTSVVAIAAGTDFSVAVRTDGSVWQWGLELGNANIQLLSPTQTSGITGVTAVAAGYAHALALKSDGTVWSWGTNSAGELGIPGTTNITTPQQIAGLSQIISIAASGGNSTAGGDSFAISSAHKLWAWGSELDGKLGDGGLNANNAGQQTPVQIDLGRVAHVASGYANTLVLLPDTDPDLNGDGNSDLLWQNSLTAQQQVWYMNGTTWSNQSALLGAPISDTWTLAGTADLTNNGQYDLIWQNKATGKVNDWLMNGSTPASYVHVYPVTPAEWHVVGSADINGDFFPDLIWQNTRTQAVKVCYLNNGVWNQQSWDLLFFLPVHWLVAGTADIDGDGYPDIIAQNSITGDVKVWYLKGNQWTGDTDVLATGSGNGQLVSIQDLDGDSQPDLIWQLSNGNVVYWQMDNIVGYTGTSSSITSGLAAGWSVARAH
jgi:alpha-tubulin suppressor-like RCC1 family protein